MILQYSQENTCARVSFLIKFNKILLKKRLWHWSFSENFAKFLRPPFLQNTSERLLLKLYKPFEKKKKKTMVKSNFMQWLQEIFFLIIFTDICIFVKEIRFKTEQDGKLSIPNIRKGRGLFKQRLQTIEESAKLFACFYVQIFCGFSRKRGKQTSQDRIPQKLLGLIIFLVKVVFCDELKISEAREPAII